MPGKRFALEPGGPRMLELTWEQDWYNLRILFQGQAVGSVPDRATLAAGQAFPLPDGSRLFLQLSEGRWGNTLHLLRDGKPLPGSADDPAWKFMRACIAMWVAAGICLLVGGFTLSLGLGLLLPLESGGLVLLTGMAYGALGIWAWQHSREAFWGALLIGIGGVMREVARLALAGAMPSVALLLVHGILLVWVVRGLRAMKEMTLEV